MTSKMHISLSPMSFDAESEEEKTALGLLKISAFGRLLTEGTDISGDDAVYRQGPYVSGYPLAEWLVWNWWRLRWEPRPVGYAKGSSDWDFAHCMAAIGEGYLWPNITIFTDGFWTVLESERSHESDPTLFRYSGAGFAGVPAAELESAIDGFVPQIIYLMDNAGFSDTNLHHLWQDLHIERENPGIARFRRFEALLGCDPDELDAEEIEGRLNDSAVLGEKALEEIAIGSASGATGLSGMLSARQIVEITEQAGFDIRPEDGVSVNVQELRQWGTPAAWRVGVSAATAIRSQEGLGDGPLTDDVLASLAGTTADVINGDKQGSGFSWVFRRDGKHTQVALRSKWETGRRFELARLLGDNIFASGMPSYQEPLSPATRSHSYRQKAQRAFAAELLSPWPAVKEMLGNDYSEENQEQVADHFSVSQITISTLLMNNADISDISYEDRMLLRR